MKDLESPEHRAMEREMLRDARERKRLGHNENEHIAVAIILFIVAAALYGVGSVVGAALFAAGVVVELAAWITLFDGNRPMPKVEVPPVGAAPERQRGEPK